LTGILAEIALAEVPSDLLALARTAQRHAYAPYSGFQVGAALRSDDGRTFAGANVENGAYGMGRCAEQSAVQALVSAGGRHFDALVVVSDAVPAASPCGGCRQVLVEFAPDATVYLVGGERAWRTSVQALLPYAFRLER
jgi:cytidine deaminase